MEKEALLTRVSPSLKREIEKRAASNKRSVSAETAVLLESAMQPAPSQVAVAPSD